MHDFKVMFFPTVVNTRQKSNVATILLFQQYCRGSTRLAGSRASAEAVKQWRKPDPKQ